MSNHLKLIGKAAEELVALHYTNFGHKIIETNYTIPGGELDIIATKDNELIFIEVKAVDHTNDLHDYITPTKIHNLQRTIQHFLWKHPTKKLIRLDIVFVKNNTILEVYKNITNN